MKAIILNATAWMIVPVMDALAKHLSISMDVWNPYVSATDQGLPVTLTSSKPRTSLDFFALFNVRY